KCTCGDEVGLFNGVETDIANIKVACGAVETRAKRIAQPHGYDAHSGMGCIPGWCRKTRVQVDFQQFAIDRSRAFDERRIELRLIGLSTSITCRQEKFVAVSAWAEERLINGVKDVCKIVVLNQTSLELRHTGNRLVLVKPVIPVDVTRHIKQPVRLVIGRKR